MKTKFFALVLVAILIGSIAFVIAKNPNGNNSDNENRNSIKQYVKGCAEQKKADMLDCRDTYRVSFSECKSTYKQCIADARNNSGSRDEFLEARKKCGREYLQCKSEAREVKYACQKTAIENFETCKLGCKDPEPEPTPNVCTSNADCSNSNEYCQKDSCNANEGTCVEIPTICLEVYQPVCSCSNNEFGNVCKLAQAGQNLLHEGICGDLAIV